MAQCNETFDELARGLGGFGCTDAPAVLHLRNPLALSNWTLPVLEATLVFGAVLALWWAIRRLKRDGDPTNLVLWIGSVVYLLVTEIPLYFPNVFGVEDQLGVVFAHNVFTVQFLYDRLPLYIVALYPALATLSFEIVRTLGVFRRRGIVIGAVCVGFVHHCFYEVFDALGPQLRWWAWNTENPLNQPMFGSVPLTSMYIFATLGPTVLVFLTMVFVGRQVAAGRTFGAASLLWRTLAVGALVVVGLALLSIPTSLFGGAEPNVAAQTVVFWIELALFAIVAIPVLVGQWLARNGSVDRAPNAFVTLFGPLYLGVLAVLWLTALPGYFGASRGVTSDGTPTGMAWYAAACFLLAGLVLVAAWPPGVRTPTLQKVVDVSTSL